MNDDFEMLDDEMIDDNSVDYSNNTVNQVTYQDNMYNQQTVAYPNNTVSNQINYNNQIETPIYQNNIYTLEYSNNANSNQMDYNTQIEQPIYHNSNYNLESMQMPNNTVSNQVNYSTQVEQPIYQSTTQNSVLAPMYEEKSNLTYEEVLKASTPIINEEVKKDIPVVEEQPKEITYSDDFMDYDPMLHNELQTDGDYVITNFDPNQKSDYVPEKTNFDSESVMESYAEENIEPEVPIQKEEEPQVPENYNTVGMMTYDTNNVDTFNDGKTPTETIVTRFIFDEMKGNEEPQKIEEKIEQKAEVSNVERPKDIGAIPIYDRQREIDENLKKQNSSKKSYEMIGMVIFFALLILLIAFFPDINKIFDNIKN